MAVARLIRQHVCGLAASVAVVLPFCGAQMDSVKLQTPVASPCT